MWGGGPGIRSGSGKAYASRTVGAGTSSKTGPGGAAGRCEVASRPTSSWMPVLRSVDPSRLRKWRAKKAFDVASSDCRRSRSDSQVRQTPLPGQDVATVSVSTVASTWSCPSTSSLAASVWSSLHGHLVQSPRRATVRSSPRYRTVFTTPAACVQPEACTRRRPLKLQQLQSSFPPRRRPVVGPVEQLSKGPFGGLLAAAVSSSRRQWTHAVLCWNSSVSQPYLRVAVVVGSKETPAQGAPLQRLQSGLQDLILSFRSFRPRNFSSRPSLPLLEARAGVHTQHTRSGRCRHPTLRARLGVPSICSALGGLSSAFHAFRHPPPSANGHAGSSTRPALSTAARGRPGVTVMAQNPARPGKIFSFRPGFPSRGNTHRTSQCETSSSPGMWYLHHALIDVRTAVAKATKQSRRLDRLNASLRRAAPAMCARTMQD